MRLGYIDVDEMLERIGTTKFFEWIAFVELEQEDIKEAKKKARG